MKSRQILLFSLNFLILSLLSTTVYGEESSPTIDDNNQCPSQIINSSGVHISCNIEQKPKSNPSEVLPENKPNFSPSTPNNQSPPSKWCRDPEISNEDKYALQCVGY